MSGYTTTPNLGLKKPNSGGDDGLWGTHWNQNADVLDGAVGAPGVSVIGAKADGVTDDSAALNAAIAVIIARPYGGKILLPTGRMLLGSAIAANVPAGVEMTIEGSGSNASELYFSNATDGLNFRLLYSGGAWGVVNLHGLTVTRGPTTPASANTGINIWADNSAGVGYFPNNSLRDLTVRGSARNTNQWQNSVILNGLACTSLDNVILTGINSTATDNGDVLLTFNGPNAQQYLTGINIVNSILQGASVGILVTGYAQGVAATNTEIIGQYDGVRWTGTGVAYAEQLDLVNCSLNAGHRGVYTTQVNQISIAGTTILRFGTGVTAGFAGVEINQAGFNNVVGNSVVGAASGTENGIVVSDCPGAPNIVVGNCVTNITGHAVWLKGTTTGATAVGNSLTSGAGVVLQDANGKNTLSANTWNGAPDPTAFSQPIAFINANGAPRFFVGNDGSTESGGNAGNIFEIVMSDDGGTLSQILGISRVTKEITVQSTFVMPNLPNSATGLAPGTIWNNAGVLNVA